MKLGVGEKAKSKKDLKVTFGFWMEQLHGWLCQSHMEWGGEDAEAVSEGRAKGERDFASDGN